MSANPPLAYRALTAERVIGLLLPCNVVAHADDVPGRSVVAVLDPIEALQLSGNEQVRPLADDVKGRLTRVLEAIEQTNG